MLPPYKGKRKLKFNYTACDVNTEVSHGGHDDLAKIKYNASVIYNFTAKEIGYLEEFKNRDKVQDLTINLDDKNLVEQHINQIILEIESQSMPPYGMPAPTDLERDSIIVILNCWLENVVR